MSNVTRDKLLAALDRIVNGAGQESDLPDLRAFIEAAPEKGGEAVAEMLRDSIYFAGGPDGNSFTGWLPGAEQLPRGKYKLYAHPAAAKEPGATEVTRFSLKDGKYCERQDRGWWLYHLDGVMIRPLDYHEDELIDAALAHKQGATVKESSAVPAILHLTRFLASVYVEIDTFVYEHCSPDALMKYPVVQGTKNQMALQMIGRQPYDKALVPEGVKAMLATSSQQQGTSQECQNA